jgi:hypothetical protein
MSIPKPRPAIIHGESHSYPVLPLRDIVVFPHMIVPLFVGREKSIRALEEVMKNDALIMLATQKNASDDDPSPDSIYETGTLASVLAAAQIARRHREGAGRRARARARAEILRPVRVLRGDRGRARRYRRHFRRGGSPGALGGVRLRKLCEAEQEDIRRSRRRGSGDHRFRQSSATPSLRISPSRFAIVRPFWKRCP